MDVRLGLSDLVVTSLDNFGIACISLDGLEALDKFMLSFDLPLDVRNNFFFQLRHYGGKDRTVGMSDLAGNG